MERTFRDEVMMKLTVDVMEPREIFFRIKRWFNEFMESNDANLKRAYKETNIILIRFSAIIAAVIFIGFVMVGVVNLVTKVSWAFIILMVPLVYVICFLVALMQDRD